MCTCFTTFHLMHDIYFVLQGIIDTPTRAICTNEFSDIAPLSGEIVPFSTLEGRPYAYEFEKNKVLQVMSSSVFCIRRYFQDGALSTLICSAVFSSRYLSIYPQIDLNKKSYCRTQLFCKPIIFAIKSLANIVNAHLFSLSLYVTKAEPRT